MLAARADLPLDRLDDAVLVADLIAARAPAHVTSRARRRRARARRRARSRCASARCAQGGGEALIVDAAVPGVGNVIEQLADELESSSARGRGEFLHVRLAYADAHDGPTAIARSGWEGTVRHGHRVRDRGPPHRRATRTSSRSPARSTCSPRRSSSSACRPPIDGGAERVVVDLTATTFIDSSSLGVLIGAHRRLKRRGGALVVVCDNDAIVKTFRITGLDGVFTLVAIARRRARRRRRRRLSARVSPRPALDTGFPAQDAQSDFARARRGAAAGRHRPAAAARARRRRADPAVRGGRRGARPRRRVRPRPADGAARRDRRHASTALRDFDRGFRPTTARLRARWERIAAAQRRGESLPPISLYRDRRPVLRARRPPPRVGGARRSGATDIDAYVTEVETRVRLRRDTLLPDLPLKDHERLFRERVPLSAERAPAHPAHRPVGLRRARRGRRGLGLPRDAGAPRVHRPRRGRAPLVRRGVRAGRRDAARRRLRSSADETQADAYLRVAGARYRLLRTHEWSDEVLDAPARADAPAAPAPLTRRRRRRVA